MPKILVAGFDAFGSLIANPSAELVMELERIVPNSVALILPTSYKRASARLLEELRRVKPTYCVMFGFARSALSLCLEQYARNRDGAEKPDNDGDTRSSVIDAKAPALLASRVDVQKLYHLLRERGWEVSTSEDAGRYVCNHTYFEVLYELSRTRNELPFLFVHIPGPAVASQTVACAQTLLNLISRAV
jgi:pyroglutamyl-peptidase